MLREWKGFIWTSFESSWTWNINSFKADTNFFKYLEFFIAGKDWKTTQILSFFLFKMQKNEAQNKNKKQKIVKFYNKFWALPRLLSTHIGAH